MNPSPSQPFHAFDMEGNRDSLLHSIRKPPSKPWRRPTAPPDKLYVVHQSGFRKLVQKLTGAPKFTSRRLREVAPAPLDLVPKRAVPPPQQPEYKDTYSQLQPLFSPKMMKFNTDASSLQLQPLFSPELMKFNTDTSSSQLQSLFSSEPMKFTDRSFGPFGFFSPSSLCSFPLLSPLFSPGAMAMLEQGAVL